MSNGSDKNDKFWDVPRTYHDTSEGRLDLPIFYYDVRVRHLNYFVPYERVLPLLDGTGLLPCKFFNGKCVVSLIFYNYREVSIPAYEEVTITIIVRPSMLPDPKFYLPNFLRKKGGDWTVGAYVLEMPVTIPEARAAGREIWGFPKFETKIPYKLDGKKFEFGVLDPDTGEDIVQVKGRIFGGPTMKGFDLVTFSNLNNKIYKTIVDVDTKYRHCFAGKADIKIGPSSHGMAEHLRTLGIDKLRPWLIQVTDRFRSRLNPGTPVADFPTPPIPYKPKTGAY